MLIPACGKVGYGRVDELEAFSRIWIKVYAPGQREGVGWKGGAGIERRPMVTGTTLVASA